MNREALAQLYKENGLSESDVFNMKMGGRDVWIITRSGIEKIQAKHSIKVTFNTQMLSPEFVVIKATGYIEGKIPVETYGEASTSNVKNKFIVAMAEKRALSRAVLKCVGMYAMGYMGEDELPDSFEYDEEPLIQLIDTSTFDSDQQTNLRIQAQNINTTEEYQEFRSNLENNQLAPIDRPHGRMSAKEIKDAI